MNINLIKKITLVIGIVAVFLVPVSVAILFNNNKTAKANNPYIEYGITGNGNSKPMDYSLEDNYQTETDFYGPVDRDAECRIKYGSNYKFSNWNCVKTLEYNDSLPNKNNIEDCQNTYGDNYTFNNWFCEKNYSEDYNNSVGSIEGNLFEDSYQNYEPSYGQFYFDRDNYTGYGDVGSFFTDQYLFMNDPKDNNIWEYNDGLDINFPEIKFDGDTGFFNS